MANKGEQASPTFDDVSHVRRGPMEGATFTPEGARTLGAPSAIASWARNDVGDRGWRHVFAGDCHQLRQRQADPWEGRTWAKGVQGDNRRSINVVAAAVRTKFEDIAQLASAELGFRQEGC